MKSARELFEELGYEECEDVIGNMMFVKHFTTTNGKYIKFCKHIEMFEVFFKETFGRCNIEPTTVSMQELQAINQMAKELGWVDEK